MKNFSFMLIFLILNSCNPSVHKICDRSFCKVDRNFKKNEIKKYFKIVLEKRFDKFIWINDTISLLDTTNFKNLTKEFFFKIEPDVNFDSLELKNSHFGIVSQSVYNVIYYLSFEYLKGDVSYTYSIVYYPKINKNIVCINNAITKLRD